MNKNDTNSPNKINESEITRFTIISDSYFPENSLSNPHFESSLCDILKKKITPTNFSWNKDNKKSFLINNNNDKNFKNEINNLKGSLMTMLATLIFSFNNLIGKILGFYYPEVENAVTNLIRGVTISLISLMLMKVKEVNFIENLKSKQINKIFILLLRCFSGSIANFLFLESLRHLRVSSAYTIFSLAPILTGFLSAFYLKAKFTKLDVISFLICFFSLILITKPAFIFFSNNKNEDEKIGIFICLFGAGFSGVSIFLNKIISKDFDDELTTFLLGIFFIIEALFVIPFTQNGFSTVSWLSIFLGILIAIFYYIHVSLFIVAVRVSNIIKILPITYFGVVLTLVYNYLIFQQSCDLLDILGSFIITFVNVYKVCIQENE
jgi:drug/metabolite transporter (DMT)-like permease